MQLVKEFYNNKHGTALEQARSFALQKHNAEVIPLDDKGKLVLVQYQLNLNTGTRNMYNK